MRASAVDLFCGAGGLTHGLEEGGIEVKAGVDIDPSCEYPYEANNDAEFLHSDITDLRISDLEGLYPDNSVKILAGCAPCQPFSQYNQGKNTRRDSKWGLLDSFARLVEGLRPAIVTMENVPQVTNHSVFDDFVQKLRDLDYSVWYDIVHAPKYGVPQDRDRLVLLASKLGAISLVNPSHPNTEDYPTVHDAIGDQPEIDQGEAHEAYPFHRAAGLRGKNLKRIDSSKPGGTWRDWPKDLRLECHKKDSGSSYVGVYGRMKWNEPAPTITTQFYNYGSGRFGHPDQDRAISLREGAILQSFPQDYEFELEAGELTNDTAGRLIGNAVPVKLAETIGLSINEHLANQESGYEDLVAS